MSRFVIAILTLFFLGSCINIFHRPDSPREKKIIYSENGEHKYETEYFNGKPDGISLMRDRGGNLIGRTEYVNGLIHGTMIKYFEDGEKMYECEYIYGKKHGQEMFFYMDGTVKRIHSYEYGAQISTKRYKKDGKFEYQ